jgi:hypothetical protein
MVLEYVKLSSDKIERPPSWSNERKTWIFVISWLFRLSAVYISTAR